MTSWRDVTADDFYNVFYFIFYVIFFLFFCFNSAARRRHSATGKDAIVSEFMKCSLFTLPSFPISMPEQLNDEGQGNL